MRLQRKDIRLVLNVDLDMEEKELFAESKVELKASAMQQLDKKSSVMVEILKNFYYFASIYLFCL